MLCYVCACISKCVCYLCLKRFWTILSSTTSVQHLSEMYVLSFLHLSSWISFESNVYFPDLNIYWLLVLLNTIWYQILLKYQMSKVMQEAIAVINPHLSCYACCPFIDDRICPLTSIMYNMMLDNTCQSLLLSQYTFKSGRAR